MIRMKDTVSSKSERVCIYKDKGKRRRDSDYSIGSLLCKLKDILSKLIFIVISA